MKVLSYDKDFLKLFSSLTVKRIVINIERSFKEGAVIFF